MMNTSFSPIQNRRYEPFLLRVFDLLIAVYFVLELTNITRYVFFLKFGSLSRTATVGLTMILLGAYLLINYKTLLELITKKAVFFWFFMMLFLPVMSLVVLPQIRDIRNFLRLFLYAEISMYGMVLVYKRNFKLLGLIFSATIFLAFLNCIASKIHPQMFYAFVEMQFSVAHNSVMVAGENIIKDRATGLFNANVLGSLINTSFVWFLCFYKSKRVYPYILTIIIVALSILLIGSRGSALFFLVICFLYLVYLLKNGQYLSTGRRVPASVFCGILSVAAILGIFFLFAFRSVFFKVDKFSTLSSDENATMRVINFFSGKYGYMEDSRSERLKHSLITSQETIFIGRGVDPINIGHFGGGYYYDPHNEIARIILSYGWVYTIILFGGFVFISVRGSRFKILDSIPVIQIFIIYFLLQCMTESKLFTWYHFDFAFGVWIAMASILFSKNISITGILGRRNNPGFIQRRV